MKKNKISRLLKKISAALLAGCLLMGGSGASENYGSSVSAESGAQYVEILPEDTPYREQEDETLPVFTPPEYVPMFTFPESVRGVYICPERDFSVYDGQGEMLPEEEIEAQIADVLDRAQGKRLNAVILSTSFEGEKFFEDGVNRTVRRSPVRICADEALSRGMYLYLTFDINTVLAGIDEDTAKNRIDRLALTAHEFTVQYPVDGIILSGYYSYKNGESFKNYMENGAGIGYGNWLTDNGEYVFTQVAQAVRRTSNAVPVGISIDDVWANSSTNSAGSPTEVSFEALTDGYADTLDYIKKGQADFIFVKADGAFDSAVMPFEETMKWWDEVAKEAQIPMMIDHINEKVCSEYTGWQSPDELVKQVIKAGEYESCIGSAFNSLADLEENREESTDVLMKHFEDTIDLEGLNNELEMTLPLEETFKTEEPSVIFAGSFDPNFTIYFQGEPIQLNEAGRFYFNEELDVGLNTFTFKNKGKTVTYRITRTVNVLKSVEPSQGEMKIEEKSAVTLSAIAYRGSVVSAEINGKLIELMPVEGQLDELDPNSNYTKYVATYVAPGGKKGEDIDLGTVRFYGTYKTKTGDFNETRTGSRIIVNALAEILNDYSGSLLEVKRDNTMVYDAKTTGTAPTPDMVRLPGGTLDYQIRTVSYSGTDYYLTNSGKRIRCSDVNVLENAPLGSNVMTVVSAAKDGTDTVLKLHTNVKIPFAAAFSGVNYNGGDNGNYYISSFNADSFIITFDYVTSVGSGNITFPESAVFTEGVWDSYTSGELTKTRLTLKLRQNGVFGGITSSYDNDGNLVLRFNGCRNSLSGATIVIDPGHGYTGASQFDPGAIGHIKEQEANLAIAKYAEEKFTARGANVIRLKTESETYVTAERASIARQYSPDVFIAVHCNSAGGESAKGSEAYYFTPYSQPLAKAVTSRIGAYLGGSVHGESGLDRGAKYNYFFVTQQQDFPSILVECGFVTNYTEAMALMNPTHQAGIAEAIVQGTEDFLARTNYSCYGDGAGSFEGGYTPVAAPAPEAVVTSAEAVTEENEMPPVMETAVLPGNDFYDPYFDLIAE
ncbi:MAG: N-acetylmuramoyl-L-alanine amidase [Oscillospiraceae bacterium]|nr:N-acetylmuramoyl-L-alanine amidase [Oscillospiraceae bacterium]